MELEGKNIQYGGGNIKETEKSKQPIRCQLGEVDPNTPSVIEPIKGDNKPMELPKPKKNPKIDLPKKIKIKIININKCSTNIGVQTMINDKIPFNITLPESYLEDKIKLLLKIKELYLELIKNKLLNESKVSKKNINDLYIEETI